MIKVGTYIVEVTENHGKEVARNFVAQLKKWDADACTGAFYTKDVLDMLLEQALEI